MRPWNPLGNNLFVTSAAPLSSFFTEQASSSGLDLYQPAKTRVGPGKPNGAMVTELFKVKSGLAPMMELRGMLHPYLGVMLDERIDVGLVPCLLNFR